MKDSKKGMKGIISLELVQRQTMTTFASTNPGAVSVQQRARGQVVYNMRVGSETRGTTKMRVASRRGVILLQSKGMVRGADSEKGARVACSTSFLLYI